MITFTEIGWLKAGSVKLSGVLGGCESKDIGQAIAEQTTCQNEEEWKFICRNCKHWVKDTVGCKRNFIIVVVGGNISKCMGYEQST